jgi:hypothetical protein
MHLRDDRMRKIPPSSGLPIQQRQYRLTQMSNKLTQKFNDTLPSV